MNNMWKRILKLRNPLFFDVWPHSASLNRAVLVLPRSIQFDILISVVQDLPENRYSRPVGQLDEFRQHEVARRGRDCLVNRDPWMVTIASTELGPRCHLPGTVPRNGRSVGSDLTHFCTQTQMRIVSPLNYG